MPLNQDSPIRKYSTVKYRSFRENQVKILTMSLLTDPGDFAKSVERYANCVVAIFLRSGRPVAEDNGLTSGEEKNMANFDRYGAVDKSPQLAPWLTHTLSSSIRTWLSALGLCRAGLYASPSTAKGLSEGQEQSKLIDTESSFMAGE